MSELSKKVVGLTGNISAGKSVVSKYLQDKGYKIIDGDLITESIYLSNDDFKVKLIKLFSKSIIYEDKIDKKKVSELVFNDPKLLEKLNQIIHPIIIEYIEREIELNSGLIFIDAALLYEVGLDIFCQKVIVISIDEKTQLKRLMKRDGISKEQALQKINTQITQNYKIDRADYVIENNGSIKELYQKVEEVLNEIERG